jgi:hypothetical protein
MLEHACPLAHEHGARPDPAYAVRRQRKRCRLASHGPSGDLVEEPPRALVEIAVSRGLKTVGKHPKQQMLGQVPRCGPTEYAVPTRSQALRAEIAQLCDLSARSIAARSRSGGMASGDLVLGGLIDECLRGCQHMVGRLAILVGVLLQRAALPAQAR